MGADTGRLINGFSFLLAIIINLSLGLRTWYRLGRGRCCTKERGLRNMFASSNMVDKEPEVDKEVRLHVKSAVCCKLICLGFLGCFVAFVPMLKEFQGQPRTQSQVQGYIFLGLLMWAAVSHMFMDQVTTHFPDLWQLITVAGLAMILLAADKEDECLFYFWTAWMALPRFFCSIGYYSVKYSAVANILYGLVQGFSLMSLQNPSRPIVSSLWIEVVVTTVLIGCAAYENKYVRIFVRSLLRVRSLVGELSAMKDLLSMMCDAAFEINENLDIVEDCPRLRTMLMLSNQNSLKDKPLSDFMYKGECDRLRTAITKATAGDESESMEIPKDSAKPGAVHLTLVDSHSTKVDVELFFVAFQTGGNQRFLIGMREENARALPELRHFPTVPLKKNSFTGHSPNGSRSSDGFGTPRSASKIGGLDIKGSSPEDDGKDAKEPPIFGVSDLNDDSTPPQGSQGGSGVSQLLPASSTWMRPDLVSTTTFAKDVLLVRTMMQWNVKVPRSACCRFHAAMKEAAMAATRVRETECYHDFKVNGTLQCQDCGVIWTSYTKKFCDVCESPNIEKVSNDSCTEGSRSKPSAAGFCGPPPKFDVSLSL